MRSFPILYISVRLRRPSSRVNQRMRLPVITVILDTIRAQLPRRLRLHITEDAFQEKDKVRPVARVRIAMLDRTLTCILRPDDRTR